MKQKMSRLMKKHIFRILFLFLLLLVTFHTDIYAQTGVVDLGLSVKWCKTNFGASTCEEPGKYLSWPLCDSLLKTSSDVYRMPTLQEIQELLTKCKWIFLKNFNNSKVDGYIITSEIEGYEGNYIFLPCAGFYDEHIFIVGGHYWSNTSSSMTDYISLGNDTSSTLNCHLGLDLIENFSRATKEYNDKLRLPVRLVVDR